MERPRILTRHERGQRPEMVFADEEHKGGRAVHHLGRYHRPGAGDRMDAVIPGPGLAADHQRLPVGGGENTLQPSPGTVIHHRRQRLAQGCCHLRRQHLFLLQRFRFKAGLPRGIRGKVQAGQAPHAGPFAVIDDDAHQLRQGAGAVARAAQRGAQRRHKMGEGITHPLPARVQRIEGFALQHDADARVAGTGMPAAEQPLVHFLPLGRAGGQHIAQGGLRVLTQIAEQPQLQRMHLGDIPLVVQVEAARRIGAIQALDTLRALRHPHVLHQKVTEAVEVRLRVQFAIHHG